MEPLILIYACADLFLALHISLSNFIVIWVYVRSKRIRTPTNAYIFSLAIADFLAGAFGIPITVFSVLTRRPRQFLPCLAVHLCLCVLCTVSTFHLLAIAIDKYLTICCRKCQLFEQGSRHLRAKTLIALAWILGTIIASMPMFDVFGFVSNTRRYFRDECHFTVVVDYRYLVYIIFFGTIIAPSVVIAFCYISIYSKIRHEEHQIKCLLRASERRRRMHNRRKLIRILLILVLTYALCWYPLYLLNTIDFYAPPDSWFHSSPVLTLATVVLSHLNCALNPLIYAYGVPGFKHSLRRFLPFYSHVNVLNDRKRHYYICDAIIAPNNTQLFNANHEIQISCNASNNPKNSLTNNNKKNIKSLKPNHLNGEVNNVTQINRQLLEKLEKKKHSTIIDSNYQCKQPDILHHKFAEPHFCNKTGNTEVEQPNSCTVDYKSSDGSFKNVSVELIPKHQQQSSNKQHEDILSNNKYHCPTTTIDHQNHKSDGFNGDPPLIRASLPIIDISEANYFSSKRRTSEQPNYIISGAPRLGKTNFFQPFYSLLKRNSDAEKTYHLYNNSKQFKNNNYWKYDNTKNQLLKDLILQKYSFESPDEDESNSSSVDSIINDFNDLMKKTNDSIQFNSNASSIIRLTTNYTAPPIDLKSVETSVSLPEVKSTNHETISQN